MHIVAHSHIDIVGFYLAALTVFYGITLALFAVGTWTAYSEAEDGVDHEAAVLAALYRDVSGQPQRPSARSSNIILARAPISGRRR